MFEFPTLSIPSFPSVTSSFFIGMPVFWIVLAVFFVFYAIVTVVLMYHWSTYGMRSYAVILAETIFVTVSVVLFAVSGLAIHYF